MELIFLLVVAALLVVVVVTPLMISSLHGKTNELAKSIDALNKQLTKLNTEVAKSHLSSTVTELPPSVILTANKAPSRGNEATQHTQPVVPAISIATPPTVSTAPEVITTTMPITKASGVEVIDESSVADTLSSGNKAIQPAVQVVMGTLPSAAAELNVMGEPQTAKTDNATTNTTINQTTHAIDTIDTIDTTPDLAPLADSTTIDTQGSNVLSQNPSIPEHQSSLAAPDRIEQPDAHVLATVSPPVASHTPAPAPLGSESPPPAVVFKPTPPVQATQKTNVATGESSANLLTYLWNWFIKGNPLAKVGITLLFLGLSYLLKYSIDNEVLSIELRLAGTAFIGVVLLGFGWYLRKKQTLYALILQGGAIGTLYITVFAAFRLYDLLPHLLAFALMLLICAASVSLAVLQRAMSLAVVASLGGYLAPILLSTGTGSHIGLFSYYLLISSGILLVSIWQSWRILNLIGFIFTFGIALIWGVRQYKPEFYPECQVFLLANLLIYGILAVLLSLRSKQKEQYQTLIDTLLLFGAPLSGFGMQYQISQIWEFGPAFSALGFGLFYLGGALIILRRWPQLGRDLALYGLAIGAGFTTLAIPLAFSAEWTSLAWLFEGLAILWVGLRQQQRRFAWIGSAVMILGLMAIVRALSHGMSDSAFLMVLGLQSIGTLIAATLWYFYRPQHAGYQLMSRGFAIISVLSTLFWIISGAYRVINAENNHPLLAILGAISGFIWIWRELGRRLRWLELRYCCWLLWPFIIFTLGVQLLSQTHILQSGWWSVAWLLALSSSYWLLHHESKLLPSTQWLVGLPISLFWITLLLLGSELLWLTRQLPWGMDALQWAILVAAAAAAIGTIYQLDRRVNWLAVNQRDAFWWIGLLPVALFLLVALISGLRLDGQMVNWPYIPLVNPLEEAAIFAWLTLALWFKRLQHPLFTVELKKYCRFGLIALATLWANSAILKPLSYYADINWNLLALWQSSLVQATFALVWTLASLVIMIWATQHKHRFSWLIGATILFVVIIKLLLIDSANSGGLARAIAFIGVAILVLIVGYFSPLPPKKTSSLTRADKDADLDQVQSQHHTSDRSKESV